MAYLDNAGDIILDAVLTDTGRYRLARGEFKITKWAAGDDEINYALYNKVHSSGSAYYDLEILQTPVLEAFTNNTSFLHSRLMTMARPNLLYLPVLKINETADKSERHDSGAYIVAVDDTTEESFTGVKGFLYGVGIKDGGKIRIDQGLDTTAYPREHKLDNDLYETQYIVEIDNRLGKIANPISSTDASLSFIDDDNIASYFFTSDTDTEYVSAIASTGVGNNVIRGPRGTKLQFRIKASLELISNAFLFTRLGSTTSINKANGTPQNVYFIDTIVRVTGGTTGYRIDLPVRFVKNQ